MTVLKDKDEYKSILQSIRIELENYSGNFASYESTIASHVSSISTVKKEKEELNHFISKLKE